MPSSRSHPAAPSRVTELRPVVTYPRDAILETAHVAAALGVSTDTVGRMDLPCFYAGNKPRYVWGQVLDFLTARANPDARPDPAAPPARRRRQRKVAGGLSLAGGSE